MHSFSIYSHTTKFISPFSSSFIIPLNFSFSPVPAFLPSCHNCFQLIFWVLLSIISLFFFSFSSIPPAPLPPHSHLQPCFLFASLPIFVCFSFFIMHQSVQSFFSITFSPLPATINSSFCFNLLPCYSL